ncbi:hypothetical protein E4U03_10135 [Rothia nasimurium]|uniref:Uncharacterized protein n=1 Tax=Rothia nasimurium TaxID=85336 RepID=A0A4Y9F1A3_9MICC|nr:hypothetical protein [Rothia nasimurium]MBF0808957.1 hypothetical protein [Rothia nasimurium]TFU21014.1 hypothetical protein E4U03_10135 [Rothia nasimurium]
MSQKLNSPQFESPSGSSDQEFTYMAIGMVAGAVPGIVLGLIIAIFVGHAAMWVSITGGIGIVLGLVISRLAYRKKKTRN